MNTALQSLELSHASARVVVLPQLGGKIARLSLGGRQWLWSNARLPFCLPEPGSSYIETADSGGFDECFPTVGPCTLPTGEHLPDHGELWSQCCDVVDVSERGMTCIWQTRVVGARLSRRLWIDDDGALELHYRLEHRFGTAFPFVWSAHPLLPLSEDTRIELPNGTPMRVYSSHGVDVVGRDHVWPFVRLADGMVDVSRPAASRASYALKLFLKPAVGMASLHQGGRSLACTFDLHAVPDFALWINHRGWTPFVGEQPYNNLAFEPCIGAPDTPSEALANWGGAPWLEPGTERTWKLTFRAR